MSRIRRNDNAGLCELWVTRGDRSTLDLVGGRARATRHRPPTALKHLALVDVAWYEFGRGDRRGGGPINPISGDLRNTFGPVPIKINVFGWANWFLIEREICRRLEERLRSLETDVRPLLPP